MALSALEIVTLGLEVMAVAEEAILEDDGSEVDCEVVDNVDVDKGTDGVLVFETDDIDGPVVTGGLVTEGLVTGGLVTEGPMPGAEVGRSNSSSIFGMSCLLNSTPGADEAILWGLGNEDEVVVVVEMPTVGNCEMVAKDKAGNKWVGWTYYYYISIDMRIPKVLSYNACKIVLRMRKNLPVIKFVVLVFFQENWQLSLLKHVTE